MIKKLSIRLQRILFKQRLFGRSSSRTMPLAARAWIESSSWEGVLNFLYGSEHCVTAWRNWINEQ